MRRIGTIKCKTSELMHRFANYVGPGPSRLRPALVFFFILITLIVFSLMVVLHIKERVDVSPLETHTVLASVRDIMLIGGAVFALIFWGWRIWVVEDNSVAQERGSLNDQLQKGVAMLGDLSSQIVRMGGLWVLYELAPARHQRTIQCVPVNTLFVRKESCNCWRAELESSG